MRKALDRRDARTGSVTIIASLGGVLAAPRRGSLLCADLIRIKAFLTFSRFSLPVRGSIAGAVLLDRCGSASLTDRSQAQNDNRTPKNASDVESTFDFTISCAGNT
jgi:hypothetical protein